jgi:hypothetical protein
VIASLVTAHQRYAYAELPIFMLARNGEVVADDSGRIRFEALDTYTDGMLERDCKDEPLRTRRTPVGDALQPGRAPLSSGYREHPTRSRLVRAERGNPVGVRPFGR